MTDSSVDVIVVGAGVAGCVTAYLLAERGHEVVLIERGEVPGAKNLSGGVLYCHGLGQVFPDFLAEAPVERRVIRNQLCFLNADSSVAVDYRDERLAVPGNAVTVLRARLDTWLADRCEEAGAMLMAGVRVDGLVTETVGAGSRVVGVRSGEDVLRARVVVAADGVNSFLAREAGLRRQAEHRELGVGVKCVVALPRQAIEERFGLTGDEGAALALVGDCTQGVAGGGFLYTNAESLSVGVVLRLDNLLAKGKSSAEIMAHAIGHPFVAPYLRDGEILEYGCHLVAEGGLAAVGRLTTDGLVVVGDAAGLTLNTGLTVRGMDLAVASGVAAAEGIAAALATGDVSAGGLGAYERALWRSSAGADMRTYARAPRFLECERMYGAYGELVADVMHGVFDLDGRPRRRLTAVARSALRRSPVGAASLVGDVLAGARAL
ncbi:MAG: FAD-dependent oxidoreductase [Bifidobacteriaceae bacterium]|jgi:electron transfer flavoprotein-quinone oxidoreductase|nr:FAD-dependent oxidoreductase [Bifidobacteriaceae bacterium]